MGKRGNAITLGLEEKKRKKQVTAFDDRFNYMQNRVHLSKENDIDKNGLTKHAMIPMSFD